ncbi:MAG: hypothetical protein ACHQZQ_01570 [SAR324 cluster bacterium]
MWNGPESGRSVAAAMRAPLPRIRRSRTAILRRAALSACVLAGATFALWGGTVAQATDEIQVYDSGINDPGQWSLQLHANYGVQGPTQPPFPGGIVPNHALNGTPEFAYGVYDWWELGLYLPYAVTNTGEFLDGGVKLRTLFVAPHAKERTWLLGVNFELGYDNPAFAEERWNLEIRPILGYRTERDEFIVNPILDMELDKHNYRPDFAPCARYAHTLTGAWKVGIEHYADLGFLDSSSPDNQQEQTTFAIVEWSYRSVDVHFGIGHGWTSVSDQTIAKTIVGFPL